MARDAHRRSTSAASTPDSMDTMSSIALTASASARLQDWLDTHARIFVLTGAGISTGSGIPDYRDANGAWKRPAPVTWQAFTAEPAVYRRYWARSRVGWPAFSTARPNIAHRALAGLEAHDRLSLLLTQNVDGLHQAAGSRHVVDLHGRLDTVQPDWDPRPALGVVMAAEHYPATPRTGDVINTWDTPPLADTKVFHAGTTLDAHGQAVTAGGRVLCVTALGETVADAQTRAYGELAGISWPGEFHRHDIGWRAIGREEAAIRADPRSARDPLVEAVFAGGRFLGQRSL